MKRHGNLYEKAFSRENLFEAYRAAARHKHGKRACYNFEKRLAFHLDELYEALQNGSYKPPPYYTFMIYEPKPRRIYAPAFCDLVVQHAIYRIIYPIFNPCLIEQSFACRVGKGTHKAADYAQHALQNCARGTYTIKLDIRKFFYRIDRAILRAQLVRKIKDRKFVDLMMVFAEYGELVGIPIGNLLSQLYALIYLDPLDNFVKRDLNVKRYCRYVDDFILFGLPRSQCLTHHAKIEAFIRDKLHLELSKYTIAPVARGVNFVGYRTWASKRFIRKHSLFKFRRAIKQDRHDSAVSILGHARRTHSLKNLIATIKEKNHALYCQLPKIYRQPANG